MMIATTHLLRLKFALAGYWKRAKKKADDDDNEHHVGNDADVDESSLRTLKITSRDDDKSSRLIA